MFGRLRQIAREFFDRSDPTIQSVTADQQIRQELAEAALPGMVTTRSHEHNTGDSGLVEPLKTDTPTGQTRKRTVDDEDKRTPSQSAVKRRRVSLEKDDVAVADPAGSDGLLMEEAINQTSDEAQRCHDGIDISISGSQSIPEHHVPESRPPTAGAPTSCTVIELQGSEVDGASSGSGERSGRNGLHNQSNTSRKRKKTEPTHSGTSGELHTARTSSIHATNGEKVDKPEVKKPTHKRFGSEEPSAASDQPFPQGAQNRPLDTPMQGANASDGSSDSGDDAPETVTASAGLDQARSAAAEEAKAAERQSLAKKEKRRKRDAHLKEQAARAKKQRKSHTKADADAQPPIENQDPNSAAHESQAKPRAQKSFRRNAPLPALLPDEILAAEPAIRPPTPPPIVTTVIPKKHKFIDADPKPPKDVKKGAVKVRVLEDNKSALPPRASKASKHLKESWLAGQQGRKDSAATRRKPGGGFLRT